MSDDLNNRGPQDGKLISLNEDWEVKYWSETLGCSAIQLVEAVKKVGHSAKKVRDYVKSHSGDTHV